MNDRERHKKGMKVRKEVLGKAYVEHAEAKKNKLTRLFRI